MARSCESDDRRERAEVRKLSAAPIPYILAATPGNGYLSMALGIKFHCYQAIVKEKPEPGPLINSSRKRSQIMKSSLVNLRSAIRYGLALLIVLSAFAAMPLLSRAQPQATTITVVNNSGWMITHLFVDWGADHLNGATLSPGGSFTISGVSCSSEGTVKVISEDADGCFLAKIVECSDNVVWTITSNLSPNCGSE